MEKDLRTTIKEIIRKHLKKKVGKVLGSVLQQLVGLEEHYQSFMKKMEW